MAWRCKALVIASQTATSAHLIDRLKERGERGPVTYTLLMPAAGPGFRGRDEQKERLEQALAAWREAGLEADGIVGPSDPMDALIEAWDPARYDEVVVSTLPGQSSRWLRWDLPHRVAAYTGVPVAHVLELERPPEPATGPAPQHERSPLGPLGVLAWGGRRDRAAER